MDFFFYETQKQKIAILISPDLSHLSLLQPHGPQAWSCLRDFALAVLFAQEGFPPDIHRVFPLLHLLRALALLFLPSEAFLPTFLKPALLIALPCSFPTVCTTSLYLLVYLFLLCLIPLEC